MPEATDPRRPVATVQNAAVEHALTAGESRRALALVGALETLHDASGDDPALTALSTTLTAWIGLRERDPSFQETPPQPPSPTRDAVSVPVDEAETPVGDACDSVGRDDAAVGDRPTASPAVVGAAVACERFDVSTARAASLAACSAAAVERVLVSRRPNDPQSSE